MSEPVFVAFATQKGGAGKSTLTALTASCLHYLDGIEVMVVDCDDRQHSFKDYRDKDLVVTEENPYLKRAMFNFYKKFKGKPYEILLTNPAEAAQVAVDRLEEGADPKVVFFDITGTINDPAIVRLLAVMDYLFVPISTDTADMKSSIRFASRIFVPRELVNKLAKTVALFDNRDLTIGAYVTNIIISHLVANRDVINELTDRGSKTVTL